MVRNGSFRESFTVKSIGYVRSKYRHYDEVPRPHSGKGWTEDTSQIVLHPEHAKKLCGLRGYSHIIVLYWIHRAKEWKMPKNHGKPPGVRLFATRMPRRPNPIGLSVVELVDFSPRTGEVIVKGLDALDGTPVLDIKPYIPDFDSFPHAALPEWVRKHLREHHHVHEYRE